MHLPIIANRLTIRCFVEADINAIKDLFASKEVMQFIGPRRPMKANEAEEWLSAQIKTQKNTTTRCATSLVDTNELIGVCGFQWVDKDWDFGYYFRSAFWGNGYATEACEAILNNANSFIGDAGFKIFISNLNVHSSSVMKRLGYVPAREATKNGEQGFCYAKAQ